jgi:hypothetical protein
MKTSTMLDAVTWHVAGSDDDPVEQHITALEAQLLRKSTQLAELREENRYLRKRYRARRPYNRMIQDAHRDALSLIVLEQSGYPTSRKATKDAVGMPERRWRRAIALCQMAAIHNGYTFNLDGLAVEDVLRMLSNTVDDAVVYPALLREFLPK